ncbi:metallophosphoesterase [uncultured Fibrobacter sp.]|uniref:metallophosphoesterase n=1 Tax=uncultured Fibrobacter sp. TaxID=261512 RepID=UPI0025FC86FA|nr:metallophosphoesterase [uncultured Fibrobacter sp.]
MKIYAISDLHMSTTSDKPMDIFGAKWHNYLEKIRADWQNKVADDDVVLIGGDISWAMDLDNALVDIRTLTDLKGKKVMVRGNHDYWWKSISRIRNSLPPDFYALQNDCVKFGNRIICGSRAWCVEGSPDFKESDRKIYLREVERLRLALKAAEKEREAGDEIYCLIHYPPFNVKRENSRFTDLFEDFGVKKVVYGHLHGKDSRTDLKIIKNGIEYYLTSCDQVDNKLIDIDG